jgi:hypothetical protein
MSEATKDPKDPSPDFLDALRKYAVRLAQPVFFGESPRNTYSADLLNGSGCFVLLGQRLVGVTCHHVLEGFRRKRQQITTVFQFGPLRLDPEIHLLSESQNLDLATFDFTAFLDAPQNGVPRSACIEPRQWPPQEVTSDDVLALAGYPGIWRDQVDHLRFYSFSHGATGVEGLGESHMVTRLRLDECIKTELATGLILGSIGGMSGGPVFAWRKTPILVADLVGFVTEYQEAFDLMYIRKACCVSIEGLLISAV